MASNNYDGAILIDQYSAGYPFTLKLNSMSELSTVLDYFITNNVTPNDTKNMVFVTTEDRSDFTQVSSVEMDVLSAYFITYGVYRIGKYVFGDERK